MSTKKTAKKVARKAQGIERFLPEGYELPKSEGFFMKLQDGENRLRILTKATIGWEAWIGGKAERVEGEECPFDPAEVDYDEKYKRPNMSHFWAFIVWNANDKKIQILQITQKGILGGLWTLIQQEEWGDPRNYGIVITKTVTTGKTEYKVNGVPPKPLSQEVAKAFEESTLSLDTLFADEAEEAPVKVPSKSDDF